MLGKEDFTLNSLLYIIWNESRKTTPIVSVKLPHRWVEEKTHPTKSSIPNSGTGVGHESTAHHSEIFEDGIGECPILDISPKTRMGQKVIEK